MASNEGLWEQAVNDSNFTLADSIALQAKIDVETSAPTDEESNQPKNDEAIFKLAAISSCIPESVDDYIVMHSAYLEITGNTALASGIRSLSEDTRLELAKTYPELHNAAMEELKSRHQANARIVGLGQYSLKRVV
jgi:hypothetical protein